jgi:hypothetical protein
MVNYATGAPGVHQRRVGPLLATNMAAAMLTASRNCCALNYYTIEYKITSPMRVLLVPAMLVGQRTADTLLFQRIYIRA